MTKFEEVFKGIIGKTIRNVRRCDEGIVEHGSYLAKGMDGIEIHLDDHTIITIFSDSDLGFSRISQPKSEKKKLISDLIFQLISRQDLAFTYSVVGHDYRLTSGVLISDEIERYDIEIDKLKDQLIGRE